MPCCVAVAGSGVLAGVTLLRACLLRITEGWAVGVRVLLAGAGVCALGGGVGGGSKASAVVRCAGGPGGGGGGSVSAVASDAGVVSVGYCTCVLCLGMCRQPPLAGSASTPGVVTSDWRRWICLRMISGTISSTVSEEYSSGMAVWSCDSMLGLCLACNAAVAVVESRSADCARLPLHLPISFVSEAGSPPALDTHTRSCLGL